MEATDILDEEFREEHLSFIVADAARLAKEISRPDEDITM